MNTHVQESFGLLIHYQTCEKSRNMKEMITFILEGILRRLPKKGQPKKKKKKSKNKKKKKIMIVCDCTISFELH